MCKTFHKQASKPKTEISGEVAQCPALMQGVLPPDHDVLVGGRIMLSLGLVLWDVLSYEIAGLTARG